MTRQRLNAQKAAEALGVSVDAVRMRARRGTLDSEHENGRLYVWLDADSSTVPSSRGAEREALLQEKNERIDELREQVHLFREILAEERDARRRADTIIAQLTQTNAALAQRVPELEAPSDPDGPEESAGPAERESSSRPEGQREPESEDEPRREAPEEAEQHSPPTREDRVPAEAPGGHASFAPSGARSATAPRRSWWRRVFGG